MDGSVSIVPQELSLTQTLLPRASHMHIQSRPTRPTDTQRQGLGLLSYISPQPQLMTHQGRSLGILKKHSAHSGPKIS